MKRSKILYITLVQIFLALIFSCKNTADYNETAAKIRFSLSCRTIEPNPQSEDMTDFVLKARQSSTTDTFATIASYSNYEALQNAELEMQAGTYDFILTSKIGGSSFEGKLENHTIINGNNVLSFAVSFVSTGSTGSTGSVSVSFTLPQNAGVGSVKAWLENRETGAVVTGSQNQSELNANHYVYSVSNIPVGEWRLKVTFYCDNAYRNENYTYAEIVHVAADVESTKEIILNTLNPTYTITYVLNGGNWVNDFSPAETYSRYGTALPVASNIKNGWRQFEAWYTTSTFEEGTEITSISGTNPANITLYAKWFNGNVIMPEQLDSLDLTGETGTYYLTFKNATSSALSTLAQKIKAIPSTGAKVYLSFENSTGLTSIAASTFSGCKNLGGIEIPSSVTSIGNFAFDNCTGLKNVTIENGTTSITLGYNKYNGNISSGTGEGLFYDCPIEELYIGRNYSIEDKVGSSYGYSPFARNQSTNMAVTIGENVTSIPNYMFHSSSGITSVAIDEDAQITSIGTYAFYSCSKLTSFTIPDGVTSIGANAFSGCSKLSAITIPECVMSIGNCAFDNCIGLKNVTIEDGAEELTLGYNYYNSSTLGEGLFYDCPVEELYIGRNYSLGNNTGSSYGYSPFARNQSDNITVTIGENVTSLPNFMFYSSSGVTSVTIDEDAQIMSIGTYVFYGCSELTNLTIPEDVVSIGAYAFKDCAKLEAITIPASVTNIGMLAFDNCIGLKNITIEDGTEELTLGYNHYIGSGTGEGLFYDCPIEELYIGRNYSLGNNTGNNYGYSPFARNQSDNITVTIGENVTSLPNYIFYSSSGITSVIIDEDAQITSIGTYAFYSCSKLTNLTIPDDVTSIGSYAFSNCAKLEAITIPASVTSIGMLAFDNCTRLKNVTIEDGTEVLTLGYNKYTSNSNNIGEGLFYDCPIESLYLGRNYTIGNNNGINYGYSPFARNQSTNMVVVIGENVTAIPAYLLYQSTGVTSVTIDHDAQITSIGDHAFYGCSKLASFMIPNSVNSIGFGAFYDCSSLAEIKIPANVESIGNAVFFGCTALKKIRIENGQKTLELGYNTYSSSGTGRGLFYDCPIEELYIGRNYTIGNTGINYGYSPFARNQSTNMVVTIGRNVTAIPDYLLYQSTGVTSVTIDHDAQITSIGGRAFYGCSNLASFVIPDSVTIMNFGVFYDCSSLAEITIPANVEDIKNGVFTGCTGLKKVIIEDGEKTLSLGYKATSNTGLGYGLFYDCPIEELYIGRNYSLGTNTGSNYGYSPFGRITATSSSSNMAVTISTSVTSIANYLFYNSSKLNSLSYAGTSAQWNALTKGTSWKDGISATKVTCTDGDVNLE